MEFQEAFYPESRFGGYTDVDGTVVFYNRVNSLLRPKYVVLDVGCGSGAYGHENVDIRRTLRILRHKVSRVIGIDKDPHAKGNPFVDEFRLIEQDTWPVTDNEIDVVVCDYVLEHVEHADAFFSEAHRALKDNGVLCIRTPNLWGYPYWIAALTPNRFHSSIVGIAQSDRPRQEVFPTFYRCNTVRRIRRLMDKYEFDYVVYTHEPEPAYLTFSKCAYRLGVAYQRHAPRLFRSIILAFGRNAGKNE